MKKTYESPEIEVTPVAVNDILEGSGENPFSEVPGDNTFSPFENDGN